MPDGPDRISGHPVDAMDNKLAGNTFLACFDGVIEHLCNTANQNKYNPNRVYTPAMMMLFIALLMVMGLSPQPEVPDYWSTDPQGFFGNT